MLLSALEKGLNENAKKLTAIIINEKVKFRIFLKFKIGRITFKKKYRKPNKNSKKMQFSHIFFMFGNHRFGLSNIAKFCENFNLISRKLI
ncbi:hypothetical protein D3C86_2061710 [compost metagenome]